jgi:hypothetical protein
LGILCHLIVFVVSSPTSLVVSLVVAPMGARTRGSGDEDGDENVPA